MKTTTLTMTCLTVWLFAGSPFLLAQDDDLGTKLDRLPKPWLKKVHRLSPEEYDGTVRLWTEKYPQWLTIETVAASSDGRPIYLFCITDRNIDERDKQICLITSLHGGPERSGTTTILHLAEWLLGNSSQAEVVRRHQVVLLMPIVNPYAFFVTDRFGNAHGIDPYTGGGSQNWDLTTLTFKAIDKSPEIRAFLEVVDRFQPEVHVDIHGTGLQEYPADKLGDRCRYQGQTMFEVTGSAYSNYALRPWDWRVTEALVQAGLRAEYPSDRFEADAQRAFWGPVMQPLAGRLWLGRPNFYTAQYAYAKYHTLLAALEVGWEASGVARLQGLLELGNGCWQSEPTRGYPVDRVKAFIGHYVTAWGRTAVERRRSRVELWQRQEEFTQAVLYPQTDGRDTYIVALTKDAAEMLDPDPAVVLRRINDLPDMQADNVAAFIEAGPEIKLAIASGQSSPLSSDSSIVHGMGLRLRIPYRAPQIVDLRLNGHLLQTSSTDGYQSWQANGFTQLQINVPPESTKDAKLLIVTCAYVPDVERRYGWLPPAEITE